MKTGAMKMGRLAALAIVLGAAAAASAVLAQVAPPVRYELHVPDLPGFKTLKGDFHLHSVFSDGRVLSLIHI